MPCHNIPWVRHAWVLCCGRCLAAASSTADEGGMAVAGWQDMRMHPQRARMTISSHLAHPAVLLHVTTAVLEVPRGVVLRGLAAALYLALVGLHHTRVTFLSVMHTLLLSAVPCHNIPWVRHAWVLCCGRCPAAASIPADEGGMFSCRMSGQATHADAPPASTHDYIFPPCTPCRAPSCDHGSTGSAPRCRTEGPCRSPQLRTCVYSVSAPITHASHRMSVMHTLLFLLVHLHQPHARQIACQSCTR